MAPKAKTMHTHTIAIDGQTLNVSFEDKRAFNSFVKALEKATTVTMTNQKPETIVVENPHMFEDWTIHEKDGHVAIKPPENTKREIVSLNPEFAVKWSPTFTGKYWNDGMYHFFPKKTKLSAEFTNQDFIDNLVSMGAKV